MTPQEMIDVLQAHVDGKQIQECRKGEDKWLDCVPPWPLFDFMNINYRVKPPKLRPHWLIGLFGKPYDIDLTTIEWVAGTCMLSGFIFFTAGVTVWLWRAMP